MDSGHLFYVQQHEGGDQMHLLPMHIEVILGWMLVVTVAKQGILQMIALHRLSALEILNLIDQICEMVHLSTNIFHSLFIK